MNDTDMNDMNSTRAKRSWAGDAPALLGLARDRLTINTNDMNDMNSTGAKRSWTGDAPALLGLARDRLTIKSKHA